MKKLLLLILSNTLLMVSYAQNVSTTTYKHLPLIVGDIDYERIEKECNNHNLTENYLGYKMACNAPETFTVNLSEANYLKGNSFNKIFEMPELMDLRSLNNAINTAVMVAPSMSDNGECIYFKFSLQKKNCPILKIGKETVCITKPSSVLENDFIINSTSPIKNLGNLSLIFTNRLYDKYKMRVALGDVAIVTTSMDPVRKNLVNVTIEVKFAEGHKYQDIDNGVLLLSGSAYNFEKVTISKESVGKIYQVGNLPFLVREFNRGVVHLEYNINNSRKFWKCNFVCEQNGNKFKVKPLENSILDYVYNCYREKPDLSFDKFIKYVEKDIKKRFDIRNTIHKVTVLNFGTNIDSLHICDTRYTMRLPASRAFYVNKNGIVAKQGLFPDDADNTKAEYFENVFKLRNYFANRIIFPKQNVYDFISGNVSVSFMINEDGSFSDMRLVSFDNLYFISEVERIFSKLSKSGYVCKINKEIPYYIRGHINLVFKI